MDNIIHVNFQTGEYQTEDAFQRDFLQMLAKIPMQAEAPKKVWMTQARFEICIFLVSIIASIGLGWCLHSILN
jgi:hypothetical protein